MQTAQRSRSTTRQPNAAPRRQRQSHPPKTLSEVRAASQTRRMAGLAAQYGDDEFATFLDSLAEQPQQLAKTFLGDPLFQGIGL